MTSCRWLSGRPYALPADTSRTERLHGDSPQACSPAVRSRAARRSAAAFSTLLLGVTPCGDGGDRSDPEPATGRAFRGSVTFGPSPTRLGGVTDGRAPRGGCRRVERGCGGTQASTWLRLVAEVEREQCLCRVRSYDRIRRGP